MVSSQILFHTRNVLDIFLLRSFFRSGLNWEILNEIFCNKFQFLFRRKKKTKCIVLKRNQSKRTNHSIFRRVFEFSRFLCFDSKFSNWNFHFTCWLCIFYSWFNRNFEMDFLFPSNIEIRNFCDKNQFLHFNIYIFLSI